MPNNSPFDAIGGAIGSALSVGAQAAIANNPIAQLIVGGIAGVVERKAEETVATAPHRPVVSAIDPKVLAREAIEEFIRSPEFATIKRETDARPWWQSPTTWGPVVSMLALLLSGFGWQLAPEDQSALAAYIGGALGLIASGYALYKRVTSPAQPVVASKADAGSTRQ